MKDHHAEMRDHHAEMANGVEVSASQVDVIEIPSDAMNDETTDAIIAHPNVSGIMKENELVNVSVIVSAAESLATIKTEEIVEIVSETNLATLAETEIVMIATETVNVGIVNNTTLKPITFIVSIRVISQHCLR